MAFLRLTKSRRIALIVAAIVAAYAVGLLLWAGDPLGGGSSARVPGAQPKAGTPSTAALGVSDPASSSPPASTPPAAAGTNLLAKLPDFPNSVDAQSGGLPLRQVRIVITSDNVIAAVAYKVAHGQPPQYAKQWLRSPVEIRTTGHSGGVVAGVLAESGPTGSYISCAVYVDGVLRSHNTKHGRYQFTACIG